MDKLRIYGGKPLMGEIPVAGAKNAALKILAASLLATEPVRISNLPHLRDITLMVELLGELGCKITLESPLAVNIDANQLNSRTVSYDLVKAMRASIVVLGPLLARYGEATVALPGGCAIGSRPIDVHLDGLKAMGADIEVAEGFVKAKVNGRLKGGQVRMRVVSVTGTENLLMAATLAEGTTVLENAACEPEIVDLAEFLIKMGAKIEGAGTPTITVKGVEKLGGCSHHVLPDRIEAGTYLAAAAMTHGCITLRHVTPGIMENILDKLREAGADITTGKDFIKLDMRNRKLKSVDIETAPHPGFPTDMQAQLMALNAVAEGEGKIVETVFENRFMHLPELQRLGANIVVVNGNTAVCQGVSQLHGAPVVARDLRASASLVLAALAADGVTTLEGVSHMDRGYEYLEEKFMRLGAEIHRVEE
jgi:UDP-N-acetylglucosamine 1-carboxyvinyltransferase